MNKRIRLYHPDFEPVEVYEAQAADLERYGWTTDSPAPPDEPDQPEEED